MNSNLSTGAFYNWARWLYPVVEPFLSSARGRLIAAVNECPPGELLEIGVGTGSHLGRYRASHVTGVDVSPGMVGMASRHARKIGPEVKVMAMDGEALEFADATFDRVVMAFVLSVTAQPERMLAEAWRVLRPGGLVFILNHETRPGLPSLVLRMRSWLRLRSRFNLVDIPGWPESSVIRRDACGPVGWFTFVVLKK
jgi:phosphatidylethanolamine/phosphatidyl-N-methylethanolamine N-methyltransferase